MTTPRIVPDDLPEVDYSFFSLLPTQCLEYGYTVKTRNLGNDNPNNGLVNDHTYCIECGFPQDRETQIVFGGNNLICDRNGETSNKADWVMVERDTRDVLWGYWKDQNNVFHCLVRGNRLKPQTTGQVQTPYSSDNYSQEFADFQLYYDEDDDGVPEGGPVRLLFGHKGHTTPIVDRCVSWRQ